MKRVLVVLALYMLVTQAFVQVPLRSRLREDISKKRTAINNLIGCPGSDFSATVAIGKGAAVQNFELIVDTGSSSLGVAGSSCSTCGVSPTYSTSQHLAAGATTSNVATSNQYGTNSSGYTGWSGTVYTDSVSVSGQLVNLNFAVISAQNKFFSASCSQSSSLSQGIMGMAYNILAVYGCDSYPHAWESENSRSLVFALQLCVTSGNMWLDGYDESYMTNANCIAYVPIVLQEYYNINIYKFTLGASGSALGGITSPSGFGNSIVDSGTTQLVVPPSVLADLNNQLNGNTNFVSIFGANFMIGTTCFTISASVSHVNSVLPSLYIYLDNGVTLILPPINSYISTMVSGTNTYYCPSVGQANSNTILGWSVMNNFITIFDRANSQVGFAPTTSCGYTGGAYLVNGAACNAPTSGPTSASTSVPGVYHWGVSIWGLCSVSCGGGTQTRTIYCADSNDVPVPNSYCSSSKPATSQSCNTQVCGNAPSAASVNSCFARCGLYSSSATCNCDTECNAYKDCCTDLSKQCPSNVTVTPSGPNLCLSSSGNFCGIYLPSRLCQCDKLCQTNGDCCSDYVSGCVDNGLGSESAVDGRRGAPTAKPSQASRSLFLLPVLFVFSALLSLVVRL